MENKEPIKIKFRTFLILILVLLIIMAGICFCIIKNIEEKDSNETNSKIVSQNQIKGEVYSIKDKNFYLYEDVNGRDEEYTGIKLLEYDDSNENFVDIYYILYDYTTEPSYYYTIEITDELNNSLLIDGKKEAQVTGGMVSTARIKKINLKDKINVAIYEKNMVTNSITNSSQIQIDLGKDLEKKAKIDQSTNLKEGKLGDVNFKYIDSKYVYFGTTSHSYSKNLVGENSSLPIKVQYGNNLVSDEHIEFSYDKNVNNLNLEQAFESLALINENFGQYGLSDVYGMDITNEQGEVIDTVVISFEEMMKLCNGLAIERNGKQYTKNSFSSFSKMTMIKDKTVEIGNGINAIKYSFETDDASEYYMFIYKDNIYNIKIPLNDRISTEVKQFMDSLELNK